MFIPFYIHESDNREKCPKCKKMVEMEEVARCPECKTVFELEDSNNAWFIIKVIIGVVLLIYATFTIFQWLIPLDGSPSLKEVLISQWGWLKAIKVW